MAASMGLRPMPCVHGSAQSSFAGLTRSFRALSLAPRPSQQPRQQPLTIEAKRECMLTGTKANNGYRVTFSHKRNKKLQGANLQEKKLYWPEGQRWVTLKISTRALKTIEKKGLQKMANDAGIDLAKLPYKDARPGRTEWKAANPAVPAMSKKRRQMKNPEKLAASKKKPLRAKYIVGNRIQFYREE